jgi:hypothetical protein
LRMMRSSQVGGGGVGVRVMAQDGDNQPRMDVGCIVSTANQ